MFASLYNPKTIEKKCKDIQITTKQRKAAKEWLEMLNNGKLEKEVPNYPNFMHILLRDILGYPEREINYEEENVEFSFKDKNGETVVCFEAKGTEIKDLFARQSYKKKEQETPVMQTWTDMGRFPAKYGVATNYKNFVLLDSKHGLTKCNKFDFSTIENNDKKLKEFIGIFSYENLVVKKSLDDLYRASVIEEKDFTKEFYKLFHETRLMLIKAFQEKEEVTTQEAIHFAQIYLNRLIFLFFAEDNGNIPERLFTTRILNLLDPGQKTEFSKSVSDEIQNLFKSLDKGSRILGVFGFNGGLFEETIPPKIYFYDLKDPEFFSDVKQHSKLTKVIKLDDFSNKIIKKYHGKLNPIISNLLLMDSFDFNTEVNVKILGHIFEQSITDLEELRGEGISRRKKEGVFYTPEYITDYICRNTIIPYLSNKGATTVDDLVLEYSQNIEELEKKIKEIKILDLACGSGAFLIKAVEILLEIDKEIQNVKGASAVNQFTLEEWSEEKEITKIIEKNIFGVDINEESVEITKLSLFLKMAATNRKLMNLSNYIKIGNSLVEDKSIDEKAFNWNKEFPKIFSNEGFDIVIGNPPYIRQELLTEIKPYLKKSYFVYNGVADLYVYFIEKGLSLLKKGGSFMIIVSNKFTKTDYGKNLRRFLLSYNIKKFIDFGDLPVFEDASTYPAILEVQKSEPQKIVNACTIDTLDFGDLENYLKKKFRKVKTSSLGESAWNFFGAQSKEILDKISSNSTKFGNFVNNEFYRGVTTGLDEVFLISNEEKKRLIEKDSKSAEIIFPYLSGKEIKRNRIEWQGNYIIFTRRGIDISKYSAIKNYLENFRKKLEPKKSSSEKVGRKPGKYKWYEIQDVTAYWKIFLESGIIYTRMNKYSNFTISPGNFFLNTGGFQVQNKEHWLLAILNSKLINFYLKSICPFLRGEYYDYRSQYIETIPITKNTKGRDKLEKNEKTILKNYKENLKINTKVENRIKSNFKIEKLGKKLEDFHLLSFVDFLKEISKKSSTKLSLQEQDEWEDYFNENKKQIEVLKSEIYKLDNEIDEIVFNMYGISDDQKQIIEENLRQ